VEMTSCAHIDETRDCALGDLTGEARTRAERHVAECGECRAEFRSLQATTAALRIVPDREIPRRIGFVSDKVFEPSGAARWLAGFWGSAARLGFASACVLAAAIVYHGAVQRPAPEPARPGIAVQAGLSRAEVQKQIDEAVSHAVDQVRSEDAKVTAAALAEADRRHETEHRNLLVAMEENMTLLQKRLSTYTMLASDLRPGDLR